MPTSARLAGAVLLAALGAYVAMLAKPYLPEGEPAEMLIPVTAIMGVQIGIRIQKNILQAWGNAGSNLYVSVVFVAVLVLVGTYVFYDA